MLSLVRKVLYEEVFVYTFRSGCNDWYFSSGHIVDNYVFQCRIRQMLLR